MSPNLGICWSASGFCCVEVLMESSVFPVIVSPSMLMVFVLNKTHLMKFSDQHDYNLISNKWKPTTLPAFSPNIIFFIIYLGIPYTLIIFPSIFSQVCQPTIALQVPQSKSLIQFVLALYSLEPGQTPTGLPLKQKWLLPEPSCEANFKNSLQYFMVLEGTCWLSSLPYSSFSVMSLQSPILLQKMPPYT